MSESRGREPNLMRRGAAETAPLLIAEGVGFEPTEPPLFMNSSLDFQSSALGRSANPPPDRLYTSHRTRNEVLISALSPVYRFEEIQYLAEIFRAENGERSVADQEVRADRR